MALCCLSVSQNSRYRSTHGRFAHLSRWVILGLGTGSVGIIFVIVKTRWHDEPKVYLLIDRPDYAVNDLALGWFICVLVCSPDAHFNA